MRALSSKYVEKTCYYNLQLQGNINQLQNFTSLLPKVLFTTSSEAIITLYKNEIEMTNNKTKLKFNKH